MKKTTWVYIIGALILVGLIALVSCANNDGGSGNDTLSIDADIDHVKGSAAASVTLVEYSDFQCPACRAYAPVAKDMAARFGNRIGFAYRHFPLVSIHPNALPAAQASEAANLQGKFWEYHDRLFETQDEWSGANNAQPYFEQYARDLGLDVAQFARDMDSDGVRDRVNRDRNSARQLDVNSTPTFYLNGERIRPTSADHFASLIEAALANAPVPEISPDDLASAEDVHEHADFAVYLDGKKIDFSLEKYQSDPNPEEDDHDHDHADDLEQHDPYVHLHDGNGDVIHKHKAGVTLQYFFQSLGMDFSADCFTTDDGTKYCSGDGKSLKFFVNGTRNQQAGSYVFEDEDQLLISYGPLADPDLQTQFDSLTDVACIYSETCPERGSPPEEKCVGGLGTNCGE